MGLEMVLEGPQGHYRTNPSRDVAHFWQDIVAAAMAGLLEKNWEPWYADWLRFHSVTEDMLLFAHACFARGMRLTLEPELDDPEKTLRASGFFDCPRAAQLVVVTKIGQLTFGAFWAGIKSANPAGHVPPRIANMAAWAEKARKALNAEWNRPGPWNTPLKGVQ